MCNASQNLVRAVLPRGGRKKNQEKLSGMLVLAYFIDLAGIGRWTLLCIVAYTVTAQGGLVSGEQCFLRSRERVGNSR